MFTLSHWLKGLASVFSFHLIHGHVSSSLSVLFLLTFYLLLDFTFLLFLLLTMTDRDSMNFNPLCHFANGSFVTLDDCMPDTETDKDSNDYQTSSHVSRSVDENL